MNQDGRKDLIREENTYKDSTFVNIFIDDDYDGYVDRVVADKKNDNIYDAEYSYEKGYLKIDRVFLDL